jgi:hypothetical protein
MSRVVAGAKTDPELVRQLNEATADGGAVEAVVKLHPDDPTEIVPSPERTEALTRQVLHRVKKRVGSSETRYNVFRNLGSFVVSAPREFVRELIAQPEVASAMANRQSESPLIAPVKRSVVPTGQSKRVARSKKRLHFSAPEAQRPKRIKE